MFGMPLIRCYVEDFSLHTLWHTDVDDTTECMHIMRNRCGFIHIFIYLFIAVEVFRRLLRSNTILALNNNVFLDYGITLQTQVPSLRCSHKRRTFFEKGTLKLDYQQVSNCI